MARVIAVVNQKGGVGKTTTAVNLAAYLADLGQRVLLIDLDPQANATAGVGIRPEELEGNVYHVLSGEATLSQVRRQHPELERLQIVPAHQDLAGANVELVGADRREYRLLDRLPEVLGEHDFVLIDCPPSLGLLTLNGLAASAEVLIPVQCEYYALEGLGQLLATIQLVRDNLKPELGILGAVLTMFDGRNKLSEAVFRELYQYFPNKIFRSVIPRNVKLAEAPSYGKSILHYDPSSRGGKAYERLAREILESRGVEVSV